MPKLNYKLTLIISILLFAFGYGFGFIVFPEMLRDMIKSEMHLGNDSKIRPYYEKAPMYLDFRIYLFNVTNKEEVIEGEKPELEEIGPYFFEEWKEKFNLYDDEEEDTLSYHYRNKYIFRQDLSGPGLNGNEIIVMPHPMIMGLLLATNIDKQPMLPLIDNAIGNLFHNPKDAFYTGRAMDMLFNGVPLDCHSRDDHITAAMCFNFQNEKSFKKVDSHHFTFSLFGGSNDTDLGEIKVFRGVKNYKDVGRVISVNGDTETNVWDNEECNRYIGTDTTIVPPLLLPEDGIWSYDPAVCRSMGVAYTNVQTTYNDIPVYVYELDLSDELNAKKCFCRDENNCPPKGTFDMYRCSGMPMLASLPHFYKAEQLLEGIESGLRPKKKDHGISVNLEILTGTALSAAKRMQFSLEVKPIPQVEMMKNMPEVVLPMFWVEESIYLDKDMTDNLKNSMFLMINIVDFLKWLFTIVGAVGSIASAAIIIKTRSTGSMSMSDSNPKSI